MALSWSFPPFRLDLATGILWRDDVLVPLPPKPFAVLAALVAHAGQGRRQVVCITGEAGIGKTTLVDAFVTQVAATAVVRSARGQCIEHYGAGEAYLPLLEALGQLGRVRTALTSWPCCTRWRRHG